MKAVFKLTKSAPFRKGKGMLLQIPRFISRINPSGKSYFSNPPVLVNSLPKSGTHLLMQIATSLPETHYYHSFIAQAPSVNMHLRSQKKINRLIKKISPGEVLGGHLHFSAETESNLNRLNVMHLFIHRDPRDVIVSEAHYLAEMAPWNTLHKHFKKLQDKQQRIQLAITGLDLPYYPSAQKRFNSYLQWINSDECLSIKYEDLINPEKLDSELTRIITTFQNKGGKIQNIDKVRAKMKESINPKNSHTFHKGGTGRWKTEMDSQNIDLVKQQFPELF